MKKIILLLSFLFPFSSLMAQDASLFYIKTEKTLPKIRRVVYSKEYNQYLNVQIISQREFEEIVFISCHPPLILNSFLKDHKLQSFEAFDKKMSRIKNHMERDLKKQNRIYDFLEDLEESRILSISDLSSDNTPK